MKSVDGVALLNSVGLRDSAKSHKKKFKRSHENILSLMNQFCSLSMGQNHT